MYSYQEFPAQVESEFSDFAKEFKFTLVEKREDHFLRYANQEWEIIFLCDYGAVEVSLVSLKDALQYSLFSILITWFPDSSQTQQFSVFRWGSLQTISFNVEVLNSYFPFICENYIQKKETLKSIRDRSYILIDFVHNKGSLAIKKKFSRCSSDWIEKASEEYENWKSSNQTYANKALKAIAQRFTNSWFLWRQRITKFF